MWAIALFLVLAVAKLLVIYEHSVSLAGWAPIALFWQDAAAALVCGLAVWLVGRVRFAGAALYTLIVIYIAISVPITFVLGSPLTWTMMRGARGAASDSIAFYFTLKNIGAVVIVLGVGLVLARLKRLSAKWRVALLAIAVAVIALGPFAAGRVETRGLDRNALTALLPMSMPATDAATANPARDWRASPFTVTTVSADPSLAKFRGVARGMNVLMVVLESAGAQYLRAYGGQPAAAAGTNLDIDPTPNLTGLADHAMLFENAYAAYPESIKGLFSTLCSHYVAFGVSAESHAAAPCASFAGELQRAGYRTGLFHSGRFRYLGMDAIIQNKGFDVLEDAGAIGGNVQSSFGVDEPATVSRMLQWIDTNQSTAPGKPFLAVYLPVAGHHPYVTPEPGPFPVHDNLSQYLNALHYGDAALGALLEGLRARHIDDRTLIVVFGDHGEAFGQHPGNIGHTMFIHEENVRVPYLIAVPGAIGPLKVRAVASLIDTAPTVLDLLGLAEPYGYQGTSLLRPGARLALFLTDYSLGWLGLRDACWKFIHETNSGRSQLFDVCRDPAETLDLSGTESARIDAYRTRLEHWSAAQRTLLQPR